ncbi:CHAD domain-containing protein [Xanthobacter sp. V2C-8]|uniref:CHAD domain-containing protein n=1 Tax=Xanthobacter albus TaxID=3119929 RepID=UPI003728EFAC
MTETLDAPSSDLAPAAGPVPVPAPLVAALGAVLGKVEAAVAEPDAVEMVHDARKALKEYRSLLRLLATDAARAARRHAAEVARGLAQARDRATAREALDLLDEAGLALSCDIAAARAAIGADSAAAEDAATLRAHLAAFVADARARLSGGLEDEAAAVDIVEGLRKGYRAARRGAFGNAIAMHETRKSVVAHRYQMGFLAAAFSGRGATRAGRAQRLRDMLGAHHDIEVLRPMLHAAADSLGEGALERLGIAMARLQKRLKRQAVRLHRELFRRSPRKFARRFRRRIKAPAAA